jgi:pimeloyl-ACP methyl ester carboxylesterase
MDLPYALDAARIEMPSSVGMLSYYRSDPPSVSDAPPLLLVHSINAAGSAYEMKPLHEHFKTQRIVYAIDLPGFGFSDRSDRPYDPRMMTDAVHAMVARIRSEQGEKPIDAIALSLGSEFLARAASEQPGQYRTLGLISPTGMDSRAPYDEAPGTTRGMPWLYATFRNPIWSKSFFKLLTSRVSIRYFLKKTYGKPEIDEDLLEYDYLTTHQPGARHAPYRFVSGYLFSKDITRIYRSMTLPVWVAHGVRGDFVDYSGLKEFAARPNWTIERMQTGALPHFEMRQDFMRRYEAFLARREAVQSIDR